MMRRYFFFLVSLIAVNVIFAGPVRSQHLNLFVPAYYNAEDLTGDGKGNWDRLLADLRPGDQIVVNIDSGPIPLVPPGKPNPTPTPIPAFKKVVDRAVAAGIGVFGYVATLRDAENKIRRPSEDVLRDIALWKQLYGVQDIFFDQVEFKAEDTAVALEYYRALCAGVRKTSRTVLNPGVVIPADFAEITDFIIVFETDFDRYMKGEPGWSVKARYHGKIIHLVHTTRRKNLGTVIDTARKRNASYAYVTERSAGQDAWRHLPGAEYWHSELDIIKK